jgi:hypothetical protein
MPELYLLINAAATWYMVGLIWLVQLVHYPLMDGVGREGFMQYEKRHMSAIMPVVAVGMFAELGSAIALVIWTPVNVPVALAWVGLALVGSIWLMTAMIQMPAHHRLGEGFDHDIHRRLVVSNWGRTVAWTVRGILVGIMLWGVL